MNIKAVWKNEEQLGYEYLKLVSKGNNIVAQGTVIFEEEEQSDAHIVNYAIELNEHWITKKISILVDDFSRLELISDGEGNWFDAGGASINKLKGAIDIDISATPFSNSLPINRIKWSINQLEHFDMVYISVPSLEIKKVPQSYKYVYREGEWRYFNYHCYEYKTTVCVDENGLVVSYPKVFSRRL